jgi:fructose-1,6-bisphosphatase II / sedoheptulose-1,7-bisphosphatase
MFRNEEERVRARRIGVEDLERIYDMTDLASGDVMFAATGVTDGTMLKGVRRHGHKVYTESIVMRAKTGTVRIIEAEHNLPVKGGIVPHFKH